MRITKENLQKIGLKPNGWTIGKERKVEEDHYTRMKNGYPLHVYFEGRLKKATFLGMERKVSDFFDLLILAFESGKEFGKSELKEQFHKLMDRER